MNQPPLTQKQSGKRIMSKGRYVARVGKKAILASGGVIFYLLGLTSFVFLLLLLCFASLNLRHPLEIGFFITITAFIAMIAAGAVYVGRRTLHKGGQLDIGVPLTRANTAALPASDSLVRASSEPLQAQEAVLLRAAAKVIETPPEQLVRASTGQE